MAGLPTEVCRFAPSATGRAHIGTVVAGLLAWLDARSRGARLLLRLEDCDLERCRPEFRAGLIEDFRWFGLEWDGIEVQSQQGERHAAALDELARLGVLYPSDLSRGDLARIGRKAPDGSWASDPRDRGTPLPTAGWRAATVPLRVALPAGNFTPIDEGGFVLQQEPLTFMGDPVVRRRDGAVSYQLACVVDDAAAGVTRIVRGHDIAPSTATQMALRSLLRLPDPIYRHHLLIMEPRGGKLAKSHGSVAIPVVAGVMSAHQLCGSVAAAAGLIAQPTPCTPADLLRDFNWDRVRRTDVVLNWTGSDYRLIEPESSLSQ